MKRKIIGFVAFTFLAYFIIGLTLPILPVFVTHDLGYNTMIAGIVISTQYVMTFLCRGYAGSIVDKKGPKPAVMQGMIGFTVSGAMPSSRSRIPTPDRTRRSGSGCWTASSRCSTMAEGGRPWTSIRRPTPDRRRQVAWT